MSVNIIINKNARLKDEDIFANNVMRHILSYLNRKELSREEMDAIVREVINIMPKYQENEGAQDLLKSNSYLFTRLARKYYRTEFNSKALNQAEMKKLIIKIVEIIEEEAQDLL